VTDRTSGRPLISVLGSSGLLGTAIARELATRPVRLRLVGRRPTLVPPESRAAIEMRAADLTAPGAMAAAVAEADVVMLLAAHIGGARSWRVAAGDQMAERVNVGLMNDLIEAVRRHPRRRPPLVLFAGSMSQVGRADGPIDGTEPDEPLSAYDRHKLAAERALKAATADGVVHGIALRLATLFSRGTDPVNLDRGVVTTMMRRAFADQPLTMWHDGKVDRDLLCVDDAARSFSTALDGAASLVGRHWLVGTGRATSVGDLFALIAQAVAGQTGRPPVPVLSVSPAEHSVPTDLLDYVVEPSRFHAASGWRAQIELEDALTQGAAALARSEQAGTPVRPG